MALMTEVREQRVTKRSPKPMTGVGAALVSFGLLVALTSGGNPVLALALIGAVLLGLGIAMEWRD